MYRFSNLFFIIPIQIFVTLLLIIGIFDFFFLFSFVQTRNICIDYQIYCSQLNRDIYSLVQIIWYIYLKTNICACSWGSVFFVFRIFFSVMCGYFFNAQVLCFANCLFDLINLWILLIYKKFSLLNLLCRFNALRK